MSLHETVELDESANGGQSAPNRACRDKSGEFPMTLNVCLIASDPHHENSLSATLSKTGLAVWTSQSVDEFCANVARPGTLCIVVAMPGHSGLEMVEKLRALHVETPALLIVDTAEAVPAKRLADASVLDLITQPATPRDLLSWIECVCVTRLVLTRQRLLRAEARRQCHEDCALSQVA
jgi:FixJ family two-component response regulator